LEIIKKFLSEEYLGFDLEGTKVKDWLEQANMKVIDIMKEYAFDSIYLRKVLPENKVDWDNPGKQAHLSLDELYGLDKNYLDRKLYKIESGKLVLDEEKLNKIRRTL
jgi:hypothetical protein